MKNLRSIVTVGMIGLATLIPIRDAKADVSGNVKYIQTTEESNSSGSYPECNVFYELPRGINGYTFIDLYDHGDGYFGRTSLNRELGRKVRGNVEFNHFNELFSNVGVGIKAQIPRLPKDAFATVNVMPFYVDRRGNRVKNKGLLQYFGSLTLPKDFTLSSFGEWDIARGKWEYGEVELTTDLGPFTAGYNGGLIGDGDATPNLEHRASLIVNF